MIILKQNMNIKMKFLIKLELEFDKRFEGKLNLNIPADKKKEKSIGYKKNLKKKREQKV